MSLPALDPTIRDWIQTISWLVAAAAGFIGIAKIVIELRLTREQRAQELRWRMAQAAKSLYDELLSNKAALAATTMLDWDGREFEVKNGVKLKIARETMIASLRTDNTAFNDTEIFVRDCFDNLFYYFGAFEHHISRGLVDFKDLEHPTDYYVRLMAVDRRVFENYLTRYGFVRTRPFLERFESWRTASTDVRQSA